MENKTKSNKEVLQELKEIITREENRDENCVSISTVVDLYKQKRLEREEKLNCCIGKMLTAKIHYTYKIRWVEFKGFKNNTLCFTYTKDNGEPSDNTIYVKYDYEEEDLEILDGYYRANTGTTDFLKKAGNELLDLYMYCAENCDYEKEYQNMSTVQSDFKLTIPAKPGYFKIDNGDFGITCWIINNNNDTEDTEKSNYRYEENSNSYKIINYLTQEGSKKVFDKLFVNIEDCPKCFQSELRNIRQNQLQQNKVNVKK